MRTKTASQRDKMLEAAARLFGTHRFHEVRMEDIAAEAQVGKGTLYRYFKDKEELYVALLAQTAQQFVAGLQQVIARPQGPRARLIAIVRAILTFFDDHPHLLELIQRGEVMLGFGPQFPWQETRKELLQLVLDLFREGRASGEFVIRDPELAVLMLLGGLRSVIRFGKRPRPRGLAERIVTAFLKGAGAS